MARSVASKPRDFDEERSRQPAKSSRRRGAGRAEGADGADEDKWAARERAAKERNRQRRLAEGLGEDVMHV